MRTARIVARLVQDRDASAKTACTRLQQITVAEAANIIAATEVETHYLNTLEACNRHLLGELGGLISLLYDDILTDAPESQAKIATLKERVEALNALREQVSELMEDYDEEQRPEAAVVLLGNMSEGYRAVGPFLDRDLASAWSEGLDSWVCALENPFDIVPGGGAKITG